MPSALIEPPPESRLFDPYNPDRPPLPPDDPAAHTYMHRANGMKGYRKWALAFAGLALGDTVFGSALTFVSEVRPVGVGLAIGFGLVIVINLVLLVLLLTRSARGFFVQK